MRAVLFFLFKKKKRKQGEDKRTCLSKKKTLTTRKRQHPLLNLTTIQLGHGSSTLSKETLRASDAFTSSCLSSHMLDA